MKTSALATLPAPASLSAADHTRLGKELTALYRDAVEGHMRVLAFGAKFMAVESCVTSRDTTPSRGPTAKGTGMKAWLEEHAPEIARSTAYKFRDIAEGVAKKFHLADPSRIFALPEGELNEAEQKKREKVLAFATDNSLRSMQLELGLIDKPKPKIAAKIAAHRAAAAAGIELPVECCHALNVEQEKWWGGLTNTERRAYNEWSDKLDFFEREKSEQTFMRLPACDREILKTYIRYFAEHLGIVRAPGGKG